MFATLASASIALAVLALAAGAAAVVLTWSGSQRAARRFVSAALVALGAAGVSAFVAAAEGPGDLRVRARHDAALVSRVERAELARSGRYTSSVERLVRRDHALAARLRGDGAVLALQTGPSRSVHVHISEGFGATAAVTLRAGTSSQAQERAETPTHLERRSDDLLRSDDLP